MNYERTEAAAAARRAIDRELVTAVAQVYKQFRTLPPIAAINPDPNPASRSIRWSSDTAHFTVDVERALQFAMENKPDANILKDAWKQLQSDPSITNKDAARLIRILAPVLDRRGLHPRSYFRPNKYPHRKAA
jgi:hypothetical protein